MRNSVLVLLMGATAVMASGCAPAREGSFIEADIAGPDEKADSLIHKTVRVVMNDETHVFNTDSGIQHDVLANSVRMEKVAGAVDTYEATGRAVAFDPSISPPPMRFRVQHEDAGLFNTTDIAMIFFRYVPDGPDEHKEEQIKLSTGAGTIARYFDWLEVDGGTVRFGFDGDDRIYEAPLPPTSLKRYLLFPVAFSTLGSLDGNYPWLIYPTCNGAVCP